MKFKINVFFTRMDLIVNDNEEYTKCSKHIINSFCVPITFNTAIKACFSNKKYHVTIQTRTTQIVIVYFLLKICRIHRILKVIDVQN